MPLNIALRFNFHRVIIVLIFMCVTLLSPNVAVSSDNTERVGNVLYVLIPTVSYGSTFYFNDNEGRSQFYKSFVTNVGITYGLKLITDKERPNGDKYSFPSGHTSISFQSAAFMHKRYGFKKSIPLYVAASFVGYSRVETDNHYVEDVLAGAAIGIASSFYFTEPYKGAVITPVVERNFYGLQIKKRW